MVGIFTFYVLYPCVCYYHIVFLSLLLLYEQYPFSDLQHLPMHKARSRHNGQTFPIILPFMDEYLLHEEQTPTKAMGWFKSSKTSSTTSLDSSDSSHSSFFFGDDSKSWQLETMEKHIKNDWEHSKMQLLV